MHQGSNTAFKSPSKQATASKKLADHSENRLKLDSLLETYIEGIPAGGTKEYRDAIDKVMQLLDTVKDHSDEALFDAFKKIHGQLVPMKVKIGNNLPPDEKKIREENDALRSNALKLADDGKKAFAPPLEVGPEAINFQLTSLLKQEATAARAIAASNPTAGLNSYAEYVLTQLTGAHPRERAAADAAKERGAPIPPVRKIQVPPWNSVNIVTAIYQLHDIDPRWFTKPIAQPLAEALIGRLADIANKQVFDAQSVANLAEAAPEIFKVLERMHPKNESLELRLTAALGKVVEKCSQLPNEHYADKSFLFPMRELRSCNLSPAGAEALCSYVAKLNHLFSQVSYGNHLPTISATFHAINGISSWTNSPESERKLTVMLTDLNDRLERSCQEFLPIAAASIIHGLRGLDSRRLGSDAINQITRTMRFVTDGLNNMLSTTKLEHRALSSIIHGLTVHLTITEGGVHRATKNLLAAVERRLPPETQHFDELGALCGALTTLRSHRNTYPSLMQQMLADVKLASNGPLLQNKGTTSDYISWQTIQQAYSLYGEAMPPKLEYTIQTMAPHVRGNVYPTMSEQRVRKWASEHPGVKVLPTAFQDGFELDLLVLFKDRLVNIEVDGRHHHEPCQKIIDDLRDAYLTLNHGYEIVRIPNSASEEEVHAILASLPI